MQLMTIIKKHDELAFVDLHQIKSMTMKDIGNTQVHTYVITHDNLSQASNKEDNEFNHKRQT